MAEVVNLPQLSQLLPTVAALNFAPLLARLKVYLFMVSMESYAQSRSPAGVTFAPRKRRNKGKPVLVDKNVMRPSTRVIEDGRAALLWGNWQKYFVYHQEGTRHMPARRTVEAAPRVLEKVQGMVADYVARALAGKA